MRKSFFLLQIIMAILMFVGNIINIFLRHNQRFEIIFVITMTTISFILLISLILNIFLYRQLYKASILDLLNNNNIIIENTNQTLKSRNDIEIIENDNEEINSTTM